MLIFIYERFECLYYLQNVILKNIGKKYHTTIIVTTLPHPKINQSYIFIHVIRTFEISYSHRYKPFTLAIMQYIEKSRCWYNYKAKTMRNWLLTHDKSAH